MGNRKKLKDNRLRLKKFSKETLKKRFHEDPRNVPTHDEIFGVDLPEDESEVIKVVPMKHKGVVVGDALIHDDGTVGLKFHEDAPQWAVDEIHAVADQLGYNLETGEPNGPA